MRGRRAVDGPSRYRDGVDGAGSHPRLFRRDHVRQPHGPVLYSSVSLFTRWATHSRVELLSGTGRSVWRAHAAGRKITAARHQGNRLIFLELTIARPYPSILHPLLVLSTVPADLGAIRQQQAGLPAQPRRWGAHGLAGRGAAHGLAVVLVAGPRPGFASTRPRRFCSDLGCCHCPVA